MSLFKQWEETCNEQRTQQEYDDFWKDYFLKEQCIYKTLLSNKTDIIKGVLGNLSEKFNMTNVEFVGFMSGINTSLVKLVEVETLEENSEINAKIDFEKLLYNMHDANAEWLYNLPEWDTIFSKEKRKEIRSAYNSTKIVVNENKIGRNDPCSCGSGKKYKKCCGK